MSGVSSASGSSPSSAFSALVIADAVLMRADNSRYASCTASVSQALGPSMPLVSVALFIKPIAVVWPAEITIHQT